MAIGERIRYIRNLRGMTQKYLGVAVGFDEKAADIRIAQYESGLRTPKEKLLEKIAHVLNVSPAALTVPNIDSYDGLMHTLFALEDIYGIKPKRIDGELCLTLDKTKGVSYSVMFDNFNAWQKESEKLINGEISEDDYNSWRYSYPEMEALRTKANLDESREKNK